MRIVAIIAAHNEARFIDACLQHLIRHGVAVYLIDNDSTDGTATIAARHLGRGLVGSEQFPRRGHYSWAPLLERKEEIAATLDADWFIHVDADEFRLPPAGMGTLADAIAAADAQGYNAINFVEYAFVPTREAPDHDHPEFQRTMRWYYAFRPALYPNRLNAWKRQTPRVQIAWSGGHQVRFPGLRMYPQDFPMRHYLFLSVPHALRKYVERSYDPGEVARGWHRSRARLRIDDVLLPPAAHLQPYLGDDRLDSSNARAEHPLFAASAAHLPQEAVP